MKTAVAPSARDSLQANPQPAVAALIVIAAHTIYRGWALFNSWFYTDDYRLLLDAEGSSFGWDYVVRPFDSQFMPLGRIIVMGVHGSGELAWPIAAGLTTVLSAMSVAACWWMLVVLFGAHWRSVMLLALFASTAVTVPALMWWAAALNQLPTQTLLFLAVGWWVIYLRGGGPRWAWLSCAAVAVALMFYVKALLMVPVLGFILLAFFARGTLLERLRTSITEHWRVIAPVVIGTVGFAVFYSLEVTQAYAGTDLSQIREVASSMLGVSLPTGLLGGPWHWWNTNPPLVIAQPNTNLVHLSWVVVTLVILYTVLRRRNAWPAWLLLALYALADFALLATSRGQEYGAFSGLDYRYLTDVSCVAVLVLGLATLDLRGAPGSSGPRRDPYLTLALPIRPIAALTGLVCLGGVVSSAGYIHYWHHVNPGRDYVQTIRKEVAEAERVDLVNQVMPDNVMPGYTAPMNQTEEFFKLLDADLAFPAVSPDLRMVDDSGHIALATVTRNVTSGEGPKPDCGWLLKTKPVTIPLSGRTFAWPWWVKIGYLSSGDAAFTVTAGSTTQSVSLAPGLGTAFVQLPGTYDRITFTPVAGDATVCIDTVTVGDVTELTEENLEPAP